MATTPEAAALAVIEAARQGRFAEIGQRFAPPLRAMVPPKALRAAWEAELIDSPQLTAATPASELPFGTPAAYWLDLRGYDPAAAAATLDMPILIVQGGRDYQVTVADDLSRWRAVLGGRPCVTTRVYDADNHLFFPGSGPSSPAGYEPAQHVDPAVVADIAAWLTTTRPGAGPAPSHSERLDRADRAGQRR